MTYPVILAAFGEGSIFLKLKNKQVGCYQKPSAKRVPGEQPNRTLIKVGQPS
jgi:hypothetical protein